MVTRISDLNYRNFFTPCKVFLGIVGLAFLISLPFLASRLQSLRGRITSINKDKPKTSAPLQQTPVTAIKPRTPVQNWQPMQLYFKTLTGLIITYHFENPHELWIDIISQITNKCVEKRVRIGNASYFDVRITLADKHINTPATDYMLAHEFINTYQPHEVKSIQIVFPNQNRQEIENISRALKEDPVLSTLCQGVCDPLETVQLFRTSFHTYCNHILRGKVEHASRSDLKKYDEGLLRIIQKYPRDQKIQEYFTGLRASLAVVLSWYLQSFEAAEQHIQSQITTYSAPTESIFSSFTFTVVGKNYRFKSLEEVIKHAQYFSLVQEYYTLNQVEKVSEGHFSLKEIPNIGMDPIAFDFALRYLQGEEIGDYIQDHPWELHSAALFLQIPLLLLRCEWQLLQDLKNNKLDPNSLPKPLDTIKFEMPCLYKGMDIKGWKLS
jgi:hypothetical protein